MGSSLHIPVMVAEVVSWLDPRPGQLLVDATIGVGGHSLALLPKLLPSGLLIGVDIDPEMLAKARENLIAAGFSTENFRLFCKNYTDLLEIVLQCGGTGADGILIDAGGYCTDQLLDPGRGFSLSLTGPLDARFNRERTTLTAAELVNGLSWQELGGLFRRYGDEPLAGRIARAIVRSREKKPITTTTELAEIVVRAVRGKSRRSRIHPATKVFQSLRIATNNELVNFDEGIRAGLGCLNPKGRMVILSYHSGEDRIVKTIFRGAVRGELKELVGRRFSLLTPKPLRPTAEEVKANPRARSARLRAIEFVSF